MFFRIFVVQYGFDQKCSNRKFLEGDEVPGQDPIQPVDAVRHGGKLFNHSQRKTPEKGFPLAVVKTRSKRATRGRGQVTVRFGVA